MSIFVIVPSDLYFRMESVNELGSHLSVESQIELPSLSAWEVLVKMMLRMLLD